MGATDGLGRRVALELAGRGTEVLLHGRRRELCEAVVGQVRRQTGVEGPHYYLAELSSLGAVRGLAEQIFSKHDHLELLINNAGVIAMEREETEDGLERTFAVNYLAHFLLTNLLLPLLEDSTPACVVNVASAAQAPIDFGDVMLERGYDAMRAYAQSKLAQVMFSIELAERIRGTEASTNTLHPATLMDTKMVLKTFGRASSRGRRPRCASPSRRSWKG